MLPAADPNEKQLELLKTFRDEFVAISPGTGKFPAEFKMGRSAGGDANERPVHTVRLEHAFSVARYEVPQNLWQAVMGSNPSKWKGARNSVEMLSFDEAEEFCQRVTDQMRGAKLIEADEVVRLPSEAEWEYFARAGTTTVYSFGDDLGQLNKYAWHTGNAAGNDPPVGAKAPNPWGLYDIHGYLWEWCSDAWHVDYRGAPGDGQPRRAEGSGRGVLRGGSWKDEAAELTSSNRRAAQANLRDDAVGLRCVLTKKPRN